MPRRLLLAVVVAAVAAAPAGASAAPLRPAVTLPGGAAAALRLAVTLPGGAAAALRPAVTLPGDATAASVRADGATWIVGARPGRAADAIAAAQGARRAGTGAYVVARGRARALARALRARGMLLYAEPNRLARRMQGPAPDPLDAIAGWRGVIVEPSLVPPPVTPQSPLLALVDSQADLSQPEFAGGNLTTLGGLPLLSAHGTETAAVASAPKNDVGILGVWPGMRALNVALPEEIRCADSVSGIASAIAHGAAVINMSYGAPGFCFAEYLQLQLATAKGITLVAAAGNEFDAGNPLLYPASLPHVLTIAAVDTGLKPAFFSSASAAVDISAPGVGILTATPTQFDGDGTADGYEAVTGTSFSAPMVAAAAAWLRAVKPRLKVDQVAQTLRGSARDLGRKGWDSATGYGLLSMARALGRATPASDPHEPNDDMAWVDGRALGHVDSAIWRGGRPRRLRALVDRYEDPADVYRVVFPPRAQVRITLKPRFGDADLAAFTRSARSTDDDEQIIGRSRRNGRRTDALVLRNPSRRSRTAFMVAYIDNDARALDSRYDLSVRRVKRR